MCQGEHCVPGKAPNWAREAQCVHPSPLEFSHASTQSFVTSRMLSHVEYLKMSCVSRLREHIAMLVGSLWAGWKANRTG